MAESNESATRIDSIRFNFARCSQPQSSTRTLGQACHLAAMSLVRPASSRLVQRCCLKSIQQQQQHHFHSIASRLSVTSTAVTLQRPLQQQQHQQPRRRWITTNDKPADAASNREAAKYDTLAQNGASNVSKGDHSLSQRAEANGHAVPAKRKGVSLANLIRPGGRHSVSGIVATVFGASGLLGFDTVCALGRIGSQVIVPYRGDGMNIRELKLAGELGQIVPIPCDIANEESVRATLQRSNVVVNCLGRAYETPNYTYHDAHVKITYRLCKLAKEAGVERWIQMSCIGADSNSESALHRSKGEQEAVVRQFFPDATFLRCAPVYGLRDRYINWFATLGPRFIALPVWNDGQQLLQPIEVGDVSRCVVAALCTDDSLGQTYELGGPDVFTYKTLVALVAHSSCQPMRTISLPMPILRLIGRFWQGAQLKKPANYKISKYNPLGPILRWIDWRDVVNHVRAPQMWNVDYFTRMKTNQVVNESQDPQIKTIHDLGVKQTALLNVLDSLVMIRRPQEAQVDKFPDASKIQREADPGARN